MKKIQGRDSDIKVPILMYHRVSDEPKPGYQLWTIARSTFAAQLEYIKSQDFSPLTVSELVSLMFDNRGTLPCNPIVLTFDDGLADFFTESLPIIERYNFPATLFISTAYVNQTGRWLKSLGEENFPMLSWSEIHEISDHGIECGSHGYSHMQLDILPMEKMLEEVKTSKEILEQNLCKQIESFAYPYGLNSKVLRHVVQQAGYSSGCAVKHSMTTVLDDRFALARIVITSRISQITFQGFLQGKGLRRPYKNERLRTKINRFIRKFKSRIEVG